MVDLLGGLLGIAIALVVIALVGHGLFILAVTLFRRIFGPPQEKFALRCPLCRSILQLADGRCKNCRCRVQIPPSLAPQTDVWLNFVSRLRRLWDKGVLSEEDFRRVLTAARADWDEQEGRAAVTRESRVVGAPAAVAIVAPPPPKPAVQPVPAFDSVFETTKGAETTEYALATPSAEPVAREVLGESSIFESDVESPPSTFVPAKSARTPQSVSKSAPPSRPLTDLMRGFMDENNIRWGELISGLLIVGSAIGLVISLWATLRDAIPYFPALVFMLVTAAIHGAGMYTLERWKLKSTSRGLLIISLFLIPLNYLAAVALSDGPDQRPMSDPLFLVAMGTGLLVFGTMSYFAGRRLLLRGWSLLPIGIMGASAGQVLISRNAKPGFGATDTTLLFLLPLVCFVIGAAGHLAMMARWRRLTPRRAVQLFLVVGVTLFALLTSAGLMAWKCDNVRLTLANLAPALSLVAAVIVATGGLVQNRLTRPEVAIWRTAGTSVAFAGAALMLACTLLAWPRPELLVAVGIVDFVALTCLALVLELAPLHVPAIIAVSLSGVIGWHLFEGNLSIGSGSSSTLVAALLRGKSGLMLLGFAALSAAGGALWRRVSRVGEAVAYLQGTAGLAILSAVVALHAGFWSGADRDVATLILAIDAIALLAIDFCWRRTSVAIAGSFLLFAALLHALTYNTTTIAFLNSVGWMPVRPGTVAFLLHATIMTALAAWGRWRQNRVLSTQYPVLSTQAPVLSTEYPVLSTQSAVPPGSLAVYCNSALLTSSLVLPRVLFALSEPLAMRSEYGFWVAAVWVVVAFLQRSPVWFEAGQGMSAIALCLGVTAVCRHLAWWDGNLWRPYQLDAQLGALAVWSMLWVGVRGYLRRRMETEFLLPAGRPSVDRFVLGGVAVGVTLLAALGCAPDIGAELAVSGGGGFLTGLFYLALLVAIVFGLCLSFGMSARSTGHVASLAFATVILSAILTILDWNSIGRTWTTATGNHVAETFSVAGWIALVIVGLACVVALTERASTGGLCGLPWLCLSIPLLIAGSFGAQTAVASALRWSIALYGVATAVVLWNRAVVFAWAARVGFPIVGHVSNVPAEAGSFGHESKASTNSAADILRHVAIAVTLVPLLALTLRSAALAALRAPTAAGPLAGSWFRTVPPEWTLSGPMAILAAVLCGYAVRERLSILALAGSFALQFAVGCAVVGRAAALAVPGGEEIFITFLQWNGIALGAFSLGWLKLQSWLEPFSVTNARPSRWSPLNVQMALMATCSLVLPVWCITVLVISPGSLPVSMGTLSDPLSYATLGLAALAITVRYRTEAPRWGVAVFALAAMAATGLAAASTAPWNTSANWISYHLLMSGWMLAAAMATMACLVPVPLHRTLATWLGTSTEENQIDTAAGAQRIADSAARCATLVGAAVLALAVRGLATDPARPYWGTATVGILTALAAIIALQRRSQRYAYMSARLAALAASYAWSSPWLRIGLTPTVQSWVELAQATAIAMTLAGGFWLAIELWTLRRRGAPFDPGFSYPPVHRGAARLALALACGLTVAGLSARGLFSDGFSTGQIDISNPGGGLLLVCLAALLIGSLWDPRAVRVLPGLYALGLAAAGVVIDIWQPAGRDVIHFVGRALAFYVVITSIAWVMRNQAAALASRLRIPEPYQIVARAEFWLPTATALLVELTAFIGGWAVLTYTESSWRMMAAGGCALVALCLPAFAQNQRAARFRELTLFFVAVAAVEFGWAAIPLDAGTSFWLERTVRLLVVLCATTVVYSIVCKRVLSVESAWFTPFRRLATFIGAASLASLAIVLAQEAWLFDPIEGAPLAPIQIAIVAVVLVGLTAALISLALLPGRDPLELSERRRMAYVYTAEVVLALLFLHIYLTMPELFQGFLLPYWPFVVMGIAFFGVGVGELCQRAKLRVLSEPLQNTGAFLPLLPALGFWIHTSKSDYSSVLFVVGLLYVVLSMWRTSYIYGFAAALAGNGGLWALWHEQGIALVEHPQLWLIPPALSVLAAAHYNRDRLSSQQLTAIRYLCITMIYVSSTGDMFIAGVGKSLAMPMILAALSVAGAFAGIALRIRAFLYLGLSFLLLSLVSMVAHAARNIDHVWPWWAFGIALGLAILTLLGVFEKKRNEMLSMLEKFRQWEA